MESITSKVCKTIKSYLRDKTYCRLTVRPSQSRPIRLGWRSWRAKNARKTIRLQSKVDSRMPLQTRTRRSYFTDVVVFLSGGEGGLVSGSRSGKKCNDDEVCSRQSPISRQVSLNGLELKRKRCSMFTYPSCCRCDEVIPRDMDLPIFEQLTRFGLALLLEPYKN